jgi:dihydroflavonol-4-reductase
MRAAITGASGLVGGNLAAALLAAGHAVRATRRPSTKIAHLERLAVDWMPGDLDDAGPLTEAFRGCDVVFHCAAAVSIRSKPTPALVKANVEGTRRVIEAVRAANVPRLVHCSTVAAVGLSDTGEPCDETATWNFDRYAMDDGYAITKHQAEAVVGEAVRAGLDAVIVNPTFMFGPFDAKPSSGKLIVDLLRGKIPGRTPGLNNFVDVRDVARGMIAAAAKGKAGERYILGGETLSYAEITDRVARIAGVAPLTWNVPRALARVPGWFGDVFEMFGGEPQLTSVTIRYAYSHRFVFKSDKAKRELGYVTSPLDDAIRDALGWFRAVGMLPAPKMLT